MKALFVAILTFYGKAFSQCEGRRVKLERRQIAEGFLPTHDHCIAYRNNFAAHSGAQVIESARMIVAVPMNVKKSRIVRLFAEVDQPDFTSPASDLPTLRELVQHVHFMVEAKVAQLRQRIEADIAKDDALLKHIRGDV